MTINDGQSNGSGAAEALLRGTWRASHAQHGRILPADVSESDGCCRGRGRGAIQNAHAKKSGRKYPSIPEIGDPHPGVSSGLIIHHRIQELGKAWRRAEGNPEMALATCQQMQFRVELDTMILSLWHLWLHVYIARPSRDQGYCSLYHGTCGDHKTT